MLPVPVPVPGFSIALMIVITILIIGCVVVMAIMVIAFWRAMRAHQSIAGSLKQIADTLKTDKTI